MEPRTSRPPTGTVAFLFSDIEGSAIRWETHRAEMQEAVRRHDALMRAAIERNDGYVFKTIGDAFCAAFATVPEAVTAALDAQRAVEAADWNAVDGLRVRMAIHAGVADERDADYFGPAVNRTARLMAIGYGGQVLLTRAAKELSGELLPPHTELLDLGQHRLRDLNAPEHVFQLHGPDLPQEFPALRSLDVLPNNLPMHLTPLIGRDEEIAEIQALVERSRLVTLTGAGGIGKTRTALQVAADTLRGDGDGVWFVDLAPLDDPALVPSAIAEVFNVADEGESRHLIERVATALKAKTLLIVLDNCEHILSAAADAVDRLLHLCPKVRILATSREPLGIAGEESYRMPTLSVPPESERMTAQRVTQYAAATLFVDSGPRRAAQLCAHRRERGDRRRHRAPSGRHRAGDRARRTARQSAEPESIGSASRRTLQGLNRRQPHGTAAPADAPRDDRLELRSAHRGRAEHAATARNLPRRMEVRGGRSDLHRRALCRVERARSSFRVGRQVAGRRRYRRQRATLSVVGVDPPVCRRAIGRSARTREYRRSALPTFRPAFATRRRYILADRLGSLDGASASRA